MKLFDRPVLSKALADGINELSLGLDQQQHERLLDYLALLAKWNSVYNLTSVRDPMQMVTHHLLDSLAAVPAFDGAVSVLDVGAGGGLPGIVLAIARPVRALIDTVHKKTAFLTRNEPANVTVYTAGPGPAGAQKFDVITCVRRPVRFRQLVGSAAGRGRKIHRPQRHRAAGGAATAARAVESERITAFAGAGTGGRAAPGVHRKIRTNRVNHINRINDLYQIY
jgi:hypothetical protein